MTKKTGKKESSKKLKAEKGRSASKKSKESKVRKLIRLALNFKKKK